MSTEQYLDVMKTGKFFVVDGDKSHLLETLAFLAIVHDVTQAIERIALCQFFFRFLDGGGHSETEA